MDDTTLQALTSAYQQSPDNLDLLGVILGALRDRGAEADRQNLLDQLDPESIGDPAQRRSAARLLLTHDRPNRALDFLDDDAPQTRLQRSRVLLALDRRAEARRDYEAAIAASAALEDPDLAAELAVRVSEVEGQGQRPRLRVLSNDDTTREEVARVLAPAEETVTFDQVGGLDEIKEQIHKRIILPFQKPKLFARFKKRVGGGILMYGPPGCGKTLLARATAGECSAHFINVQISDVLDMYIGESERKLHELFEQARQNPPSVLFFDEIEALGGKREYRREGTAAKLVSQFLSELDGFQRDNQGVLVLGATNVPWAIDPAFRRPGRFDRVLFIPPPDRLARQRILEILLADRPCAPGLALAPLAQGSSGFSGADLENLVETATESAIEASIESGEEVPIQLDDLSAALRTVKPTTLEWLTTARNYARYANEGGQYDEVLVFLDRHGRSR